MRAPTKAGKRDAILQAMLDVVVEGGFHDAPMSLIAERAGASPGVIYHHFRSKQQIIHDLYQQVHADQVAGYLKGYRPGMEAREAFLHVWKNVYAYCRKHVREMRFLEQCELAGFTCEPLETKSPEQKEFARRFGSRSKGGVMKDWPDDLLNELTLNMVQRLARLPKRLPAPVLHEVAMAMWDAASAPDPHRN